MLNVMKHSISHKRQAASDKIIFPIKELIENSGDLNEGDLQVGLIVIRCHVDSILESLCADVQEVLEGK